MNKFLKVAAGAGLLASLALVMNANAAVIDSPSGTALSMQAANYMGQGPQTLAPGITWRSDTITSVYGYTGNYSLLDNGSWSGVPYVGLNASSGTMIFQFDKAVAGFGGFFNYVPTYYGSAVIRAYDASGTQLESFTLDVSTLNAKNDGEYVGFLDKTADISSFTMSGAYIIGRNFNVQSSAVPEPASLCLLGLGLVGIAVARRKAGRG